MWTKITIWLAKRKLLVYAFSIATAICLALAASKSKFTKNVFDILPFSDEVLDWHEFSAKKFRQSESLMFLISADKNAREAALELSGKIEALGGKIENKRSENADMLSSTPFLFREEHVEDLKSRISPENVRKFANEAAKANRSAFFSAGAMLRNPCGVLTAPFESAMKELSGGMDSKSFERGIIFKGDKLAFFSAKFKENSADSDSSEVLVEKVKQVIKSLEKKYPDIKISFAGAYRISADNAKIASSDASSCLVFTLIAVFVLCLLSFKEPIKSPLALLPSAVGAAAAFAAVALVFGEISAISIAFASIATGVGMDYAIHLILKSENSADNLPATEARIGKDLFRPILTVSGTTAIGFVVMCLFGEIVQIGLFGAVSIVVSATFCLTFLPALLSGNRKYRLPPTLFDSLSNKIFFAKNRKPALLFALLATLAAIPFALNVKFDGNPASLSALEDSSAKDSSEIKKFLGKSKSFVISKGKTLDEALIESEKLSKLSAKKLGAKVFDISKIFPHEKLRGENISRWRAFWENGRFEAFEKNLLSEGKKSGISPKAFRFALDSIKNPKPQTEKALDFLSPIISVDNDGAAVLAEVFETKIPPKKFAEFVSENFPNSSYIGSDFLGEHISEKTFNWLVRFALISLLAVSAYLRICLKDWKSTALVLLPVMVGLCWSFGIMGALQIPINMVNVIFVIFSVCIAQDYAAFLVFARRSKSELPVSAITLSALTTITAFGSLAFARHPMLSSLGSAAAISIFAIFVATLAIIPNADKKK